MNVDMTENKSKRGGARPGAGRKALPPEELQARKEQRRQILLDELLFPAIVTAFKCDPGVFKDRYLNVELSKDQIKRAYGVDGLAEWMSYFTIAKIGGVDRFGVGYKTRWVMNLNKYAFILKLLESLGHSPTDLPHVWFPPKAMLDRLVAIEAKRMLKEKK